MYFFAHDCISAQLAIEGGFQLEFLSISQVINPMTCYKFESSHWWKIYFKKTFTGYALQSECCDFNQ
jgi:hypothetical protein